MQIRTFWGCVGVVMLGSDFQNLGSRYFYFHTPPPPSILLLHKMPSLLLPAAGSAPEGTFWNFYHLRGNCKCKCKSLHVSGPPGVHVTQVLACHRWWCNACFSLGASNLKYLPSLFPGVSNQAFSYQSTHPRQYQYQHQFQSTHPDRYKYKYKYRLIQVQIQIRTDTSTNTNINTNTNPLTNTDTDTNLLHQIYNKDQMDGCQKTKLHLWLRCTVTQGFEAESKSKAYHDDAEWALLNLHCICITIKFSPNMQGWLYSFFGMHSSRELGR